MQKKKSKCTEYWKIENLCVLFNKLSSILKSTVSTQQTEGIMSIFELNFHLKKEHKFQNQCYAFMPSKNQIQNFLIHSFSIQ